MNNQAEWDNVFVDIKARIEQGIQRHKSGEFYQCSACFEPSTEPVGPSPHRVRAAPDGRPILAQTE